MQSRNASHLGMSKLAFLLAVALAVESYGVYGADQVRHATYDCKLEVGPLCYAWETNILGKMVGAHGSIQIEDAYKKARKSWQKEVVDKLKNGTLEEALQKLEGGVERAKNLLDGKR